MGVSIHLDNHKNKTQNRIMQSQKSNFHQMKTMYHCAILGLFCLTTLVFIVDGRVIQGLIFLYNIVEVRYILSVILLS